MFKNSTFNDKNKEIDVTKKGKNFLDLRIQCPSVQAVRIKASRVQTSRVQAPCPSEFKCPGVQNPSVQSMCPESSFSGIPLKARYVLKILKFLY